MANQMTDAQRKAIERAIKMVENMLVTYQIRVNRSKRSLEQFGDVKHIAESASQKIKHYERRIKYLQNHIDALKSLLD